MLASPGKVLPPGVEPFIIVGIENSLGAGPDQSQSYTVLDCHRDQFCEVDRARSWLTA
jgi:hypothetical protein